MNLWTKRLVFALLGFAIGCLLTAVLAQRASYFWTMEQLARISFSFEEDAKKAAASGRKEDAKQSLIAALRLRQAVAETGTNYHLIWPIDMPAAMVLEVVQDPMQPTMRLDSAFSDPSVTFVYECALVALSFSSAEDQIRNREFSIVAAKYPKSVPENCASVGSAYWAK